MKIEIEHHDSSNFWLEVGIVATCLMAAVFILAFDHPDYLRRSAIGMIDIYNLLPEWAVNEESVKIFSMLCSAS